MRASRLFGCGVLGLVWISVACPSWAQVDQYEPNAAASEAAFLTTSSSLSHFDPWATAYLESGEDDWYFLQPGSASDKYVAAWIVGATQGFGNSANFDTRLEVYRGDTAQPLAANDDIESGVILVSGVVGVPLVQDVSAVLRVAGWKPADVGCYRLYTLTSLAGAARDATEVEANDSSGAANVFMNGDNISGAIDVVGDEDWFQVNMGIPGGEDLLVALQNDTAADLKVEVYDPTSVFFPLNGTYWDGGSADNDYLVIPNGNHTNPIKLFRVRSTGTTGPYRLFFGSGVPADLHCSSPSLAIPDNLPAGVSDTLFIGTEALIDDLNVRVKLSHTAVSDLRIELEHSETGTTVQLFNQTCPGADDIDAIFDDDAGPNLCASPVTGLLQPASALSAFNGENLKGTWILRVGDHVAVDTGILESWCLELAKGGAPPTPTPSPTATTTSTPTVTPTETPVPFDCSAGYTSGPAVPLLDSPAAGVPGVVTDTIVISATGAITDLNLFLDLTHPDISDLQVYLDKEGVNQRAALLQTTCQGALNDDNVNMLFDDEGTVFQDPVDCPPTDPTNPIRPVNMFADLAKFDSLDLAGTWILRIEDTNPGGTGTLNRWCLIPQTAVSNPPTHTPTPTPFPYDCSGANHFSVEPNLPVGDSNDPDRTIRSPIVVPDNAVITDVNVFVGIADTDISDIRVRLEHIGSNKVVVLYDGRCSTDGMAAVFDDQGAPLACPLLDPAQSLQPTDATHALSTFNGEIMSGTWNLVVDDFGFQRGTSVLQKWCLLFNSGGGGPTPTATPIQSSTPTATPTVTPTPSPTLSFDRCDATLSRSPALAIPDVASPVSVTDTLVVSATGTIQDLDIFVDISHPRSSDLVMNLHHVDSGLFISLFNGPFCPTTNGADVFCAFDDEGITQPCPPVSVASIVPESPFNPLSQLDGEDLQGTWQLVIADVRFGETGTLNRWCLLPTLVGSATCTNTADLNGDSEVDAKDLLEMYRQLRGDPPSQGAGDADLDCNMVLDDRDLLRFQRSWKP